MEVEPAVDTLEALQNQEITLTLDASDLVERVYEGLLRFSHNAAGGEIELQITLFVYANDVESEEAALPVQFGITGVYPNPFNAVMRINYSLQQADYIKLALHDLIGREVGIIEQDFKPCGSYTTSYDASHLPSGVYILSLTTNERNSVRKVLLVK